MIGRFPIYVVVGISLFVVFLLQFFLKLEWPFLAELQSDEMYKRWSGLGLTILIILQWVLTIVKIKKKWQSHSARFVEIHKWLGALSPVIYYIHSTTFGYAYLFFLSTLFFGNMIIAFMNPEAINSKNHLYLQIWMIIHSGLSVVITTIMFYHIWVVFSYK